MLQTIVYFIYQNGFESFKMDDVVQLHGYRLLIILRFTLIQMKLQKNWVHYLSRGACY